MFGALGEEPLLKLARACRQRTYRRGQYLWYQDDVGDRLIVICEGSVKVLVASERGDEIVLTSAGVGEVLGELAVLDGSRRSASVVALEDTTVLGLDRAIAVQLMATEPAVLDAVLRSLAGLVRRLTEQTADLVFLDLGGRLAKLLLSLVHDTGRTADPAVVEPGPFAVRPGRDGRCNATGSQPGPATAGIPRPDHDRRADHHLARSTRSAPPSRHIADISTAENLRQWNHHEVAVTLHNLSSIYRQRGDLDAAEHSPKAGPDHQTRDPRRGTPRDRWTTDQSRRHSIRARRSTNRLLHIHPQRTASTTQRVSMATKKSPLVAR